MIKQIDLQFPRIKIQVPLKRQIKKDDQDPKDILELSRKLGIDGRSIIKSLNLNKDGKLSDAEYQRGLLLLKQAVTNKMEANASPETKEAVKALVAALGPNLKQIQTTPVPVRNDDYGQGAIVKLSR